MQIASQKGYNMKPKTKKQLIEAIVVLAIILAVAMFTRGRWLPTPEEMAEAQVTQDTSAVPTIDENGVYTDKDNVALYIHTYRHLPPNYITKKEAEELGWNSKEGNLLEVAPGKSIGGSRFGNYDGELPEEKGREYKECDIDYESGHRNAKRIIFSNDGLIFYTDDHYENFEQLY